MKHRILHAFSPKKKQIIHLLRLHRIAKTIQVKVATRMERKVRAKKEERKVEVARKAVKAAKVLLRPCQREATTRLKIAIAIARDLTLHIQARVYMVKKVEAARKEAKVPVLTCQRVATAKEPMTVTTVREMILDPRKGAMMKPKAQILIVHRIMSKARAALGKRVVVVVRKVERRLALQYQREAMLTQETTVTARAMTLPQAKRPENLLYLILPRVATPTQIVPIPPMILTPLKAREATERVRKVEKLSVRLHRRAPMLTMEIVVTVRGLTPSSTLKEAVTTRILTRLRARVAPGRADLVDQRMSLLPKIRVLHLYRKTFKVKNKVKAEAILMAQGLMMTAT